MKAYTIEYKEHSAADVEFINVLADSKDDAYEKAFDAFEELYNGHPYSFWVAGVTYQNGNYHKFNTFEGNPV